MLEKKITSSFQNVMVTFGGDDLRNLTPKILKILTTHFPFLNKNVIIGKGFKNTHLIEEFKDEKTNLIFYPDAEYMLEIMLKSDIAISAAGQTLYELARVGLPTIAIGVAHNQIHNLENWEKAGFVEVAGFWGDENIYDHIVEKIELLKSRDLRIKMFSNGRKYVDGKGAYKIVKYCLNHYYADKIDLRPVKLEDIYDILELSNENEVRKNSFNEGKIRFEDHEKWFRNKIIDPKNLFLIINIEEDFAGQVRFDFDTDSAVISISIKKQFRELGLAKHAIKRSIEYLKINYYHIKKIKAYIKENNEKSLKLFKSMNFKYENNVRIRSHDAVKCVYTIRD
ncbi:bifunctional UDP-2,4-diacetamido-2,4,6-trideoxy-beta-L-altropyranose hydrolase/GNAT family N-acetyltransferase [Methanobacterium ferruginis]|uniref:bifunctional UDP-2,4-diacetamido-2,4,6-trideoxy-beta-L-altropyranose hydrolase/GNAT family N-acetyltransferase n=1 Tax=Methanobacterium ferruginis TaxID=710191 RepID=UPI0025733FC3|nr:bifunctional UDP-2,4-diacetamido-2,4,6-trideoxy-beta-L-altropyranose hydrolase/GNAT family N-acetyltransferase [Methanobacterium ferruginis]